MSEPSCGQDRALDQAPRPALCGAPKKRAQALVQLGLLGLCAQLASCAQPKPPPPPPPPPPPRADLVLVSGNIARGTEKAQALAIKGGRIAAVGSTEAMEPWIGGSTKVIDLKGSTVVPGLADSHMHLAALGVRRFGADLVGARSLEEVKAQVKRAVDSAKPGEWIRGRGWDQNDWASFKGRRGRFPTARDLDRISPKNPVVLTRIDGHAIWVNSLAMKQAGVTRRTRTPKGGQIIKSRGRPSGIFVDNAMSLILDRVPPLTAEELKRAVLLAQKECLSAGLTQIHDMGLSKTELDVYRALDDQGQLKLRVYAMHDGSAEDIGARFDEGLVIPEPDSPKRLTIRGVKFMLDGALGSRGAALLQPYSDDRRNKGTLLIDPQILEARVKSAKEKGFQVATHAIGDKANRLILDIYGRVFGPMAASARPRVEHAQILHPDDIPRFGQLGVIASIQPTHTTSDMTWAEKRVGKERIQGAYAWRKLLTASATITGGSDAPVEDISPILGLYAARFRQDLFGEPEGGWRPEEKLTAQESLDAFSKQAAYASFREAHAGQLKEGYVADLTVLDKDPLTANEDQLATTQIMLTIIQGELIYVRPGADQPPMVKTSSTSSASASLLDAQRPFSSSQSTL